MTGLGPHIAAYPPGGNMIEEAADLSLVMETVTTHPTDPLASFSPIVRPAEDFVLSKLDSARNSPPSRFPKSLKIGVWNCRGLITRTPEIYLVMDEIGCDILILTETFRFPGCPWPQNLPPCLGEATAIPLATTLKNSAGVAVLVNPSALGIDGSPERIKSFSILEIDNVHGTKVVLRINNFILYAAYTAPNPMGSETLRQFSADVASLASDGTPIIFCGDFNAHSTSWGSQSNNDRGTIITALLDHSFFRADTGPEPTRPASRIDAVWTDGSIIDHILGANIDLCHAKCHDEIGQTSDHRPISATVVPAAPRVAQSTKYWRLRLSKLDDQATKARFIQDFNSIYDKLID